MTCRAHLLGFVLFLHFLKMAAWCSILAAGSWLFAKIPEGNRRLCRRTPGSICGVIYI